MVSKFIVQLFFPGQGFGTGGQHLLLEFLQLRRNEALGVLQGLAANVITGDIFRLQAADLDVVAVHAVIADLEGGETGTRLFLGFQFRQEVAGVGAQLPQFIEFTIEAVGDDTAFADNHGGIVEDGPREQPGEFGIGLDIFGKGLQAGRIDGSDIGRESRQHVQGIAQVGKVARTGVAQGNAGQDALHVPDGLECFLQGFETVIGHQGGNGILALADFAMVAYRPVQPARQEPGAHGCGAA